jgi:transportin-3
MPQWKNVVPQFVELFGKSSETIPALLEFLTVLPEEVNNNNRIPIGVSWKMDSFQLISSYD